jgi:ketosteroid isomerase-like protein
VMLQENVRLVERAIAAINARDIEGYLACCTENVKLETPMAAVGGVYEGIDGIRRFFTDVEDAAPDYRMELDGVEEVDSKRVLAFLRTSSTGRASGIRMTPPITNVYDLIDGKISHIRIFFDRQEALKAVGLEGTPRPRRETR